MTAVAAPVLAADCAVEIEGNDAMQFNKPTISVPASCKLPKTAMGHNWVLSKTADLQAVANDGIAAGAAKDFVKEKDARVIAHTKVIGGGETDSVTFSTAALKAGEAYSYFCSFPGHSALMKGTLTLAK
jgi:azurin